jgi:heat shock protein HslJ
MRRHRSLLATAAAGLVLLTAACGDEEEGGDATGDTAAAANLPGTNWELVPDSMDIDIPAGTVVTAAFTEDAVSGNSGCNTFNGAYTVTGDGGLSISDVATTQMACEPGQTAVETAFLADLALVAAFEIDDDELAMSDADGDELLRFEPA